MAVEKVVSDSPVVGEKGIMADENAPTKEAFTATGEEYEQDDFMTRTGLNAKSFTRKHYGLGLVELDRKMKPRHLQMVAIGGSIGAGFFVGSGSALSKGGPATLFIDFFLVGVMVFNVVYAMGELAVMYPISGGFYTYAARFIDPSFGFAMAWNYTLQWAATLPLELTVCAITIQYWSPDISPGVWIAVFLAAITILNMFGTLGYAEEEFWAACFKLTSISIFMIIALVLVCGGGPSSGSYDTYQGFKLWHDPGAFKNGFKGFCSVFVTAAFSFAGSELVGLAAAESRNPTASVPAAIKQVFWRICLFYIVALLFVGLLISCNDENLLSSSSYSNSAASPFVLVGKYSGLKGLDHYMNAVILSSVLSLGIASVYGGSRTLLALAQQGFAPKIFTWVDRAGRPLPSVGFIIAFGCLAFLNLDAAGPVIFDWLLALSGLAMLVCWGSICLAHIRFRAAWKYNGHTLDEIPFKAIGGVWGSWLGLIFVVVILIAQFYVAIVAPVGESGMGTVEDFFMQYLGLPIVLAFWAGGYLWKRTSWISIEKIDIDTGRREHDWEAINAWRTELATFPWWKRLRYTLFYLSAKLHCYHSESYRDLRIMDTTMNNTSPQSQSDLPWDSLVDTFPFLTTQAYQALSIQLQFFRNMSTANLPIPEDITTKERLKTILDKAKLVNELMSSLTHSSELLIELKNLEFDEMIDARREEVSSMIDEAGENMEKVINMQAKEESEKVPGQQGAEPGVAEVQNQQKPPEQQIPIDQMLGELGLEVPRPQEAQVPLVQPTAPQQSTIPQQIPGLHQASALPTGHQGYNPVPVHNQAPVLGQVPAHPLPETVPIPRRDSVYTETSTTSFDDSKILRMVDKAMEKQKQKERAAKRMAKMRRERERGDFCKRCGRC
ncbi:amino acid permease-domain-containing protein [Fusarium redolens]|uniref:Amino acid permease-domain-containing protein n=2 Tax=Fusarium TaxID=5506 RepID=A0A9P9GQU0_FUSRE|nr:amino acid permease-domain-containing protein [Fusarium redolens]KAH7243631.1 amino acid permease-domain-containing protein [Fusarium redolens]